MSPGHRNTLASQRPSTSPCRRANPAANSLLPLRLRAGGGDRSPVRARLRYSGAGGPPSPPQPLANLCIRAPRFPGSPAWRWLWGQLGLERLLGPGTAASRAGRRRARAVKPQGRRGEKRRCLAGALRRVHVPVPEDISGRGLCSDALTPARIAGVQGRSDLHSLRPGENSGNEG